MESKSSSFFDIREAREEIERNRQQRDELLAALLNVMPWRMDKDGSPCCCPSGPDSENTHSTACEDARSAIARAKGDSHVG